MGDWGIVWGWIGVLWTEVPHGVDQVIGIGRSDIGRRASAGSQVLTSGTGVMVLGVLLHIET